MRMFRFILATLLLVTIPFGVNAEEKIIKSDFKVRKNISLSAIDGSPILLNANKSFAEYQVFDFGDEGTTIILNYRLETKECGEDGKPVILENTYSWSSKRMLLGYQSQKSREEVYAVLYGDQNCSAMASNYVDGEMRWALIISSEPPQGSNFADENIIGLDVDALRTKFIKENMPGRLSEGRKMGEYMVYDMLSIGSRKRYQSNGDYYYEANANTPYIRFYFKNGKLEKYVFLD